MKFSCSFLGHNPTPTYSSRIVTEYAYIFTLLKPRRSFVTQFKKKYKYKAVEFLHNEIVQKKLYIFKISYTDRN